LNQNLNPEPRNQPAQVKTIEHTARSGISKRQRGESRQKEGEICRFEITVLMVTWLELLMEVSAHFAASLILSSLTYPHLVQNECFWSVVLVPLTPPLTFMLGSSS
jgi:hypothetical protein